MSLFRMAYVRQGAARTVTFAAADLVAALVWADWWSAAHSDPRTEVSVLTLPPSRFGARLVGGAESRD